MVAEGVTFHEALKRVAALTVFTTHTPVAAGHDRFAAELIEQNLGPLARPWAVPRPAPGAGSASIRATEASRSA